jgi:hypothetical protein
MTTKRPQREAPEPNYDALWGLDYLRRALRALRVLDWYSEDASAAL